MENTPGVWVQPRESRRATQANPRSISHAGEAPAAPSPWALSVLLSAVLSSALQEKAEHGRRQALQGSSSVLCSFCNSWQKCPAELRILLVFPQYPQPPPGLTLQPLLPELWLSALSTGGTGGAESPSLWPRAARTGRHKGNKSPPVPSTPAARLGSARE